MRIYITGKNLNITDSLKDYATKKIKKLERYFEPGTEIHVTMMVERARHIIEVTIPFDGAVLRGEESTDDMYTSIDRVLEKLEKQIHRHRTRLEKRLKEGAFHFEEPLFMEDLDFSEDVTPSRIVRTKRFAIKPMGLEEAAMQMDLLGHSFFVFTNGNTDEVNVLYKRKDGNYGLIEPEYT